MALRILLQDRISKLFLKNDNEWTSKIEDAREFQQVVDAADYVHAQNMANADVLMRFDDPKYDVRISPQIA
jgi:hypothetical protein